MTPLETALLADAKAIRDIRIDMVLSNDTYLDLADGKVAHHLMQATAFLQLAEQSLKLAKLEAPAR